MLSVAVYNHYKRVYNNIPAETATTTKEPAKPKDTIRVFDRGTTIYA